MDEAEPKIVRNRQMSKKFNIQKFVNNPDVIPRERKTLIKSKESTRML